MDKDFLNLSLLEAAETGDVDKVKLLLEARVDPRIIDSRALCGAARSGHGEIVQALLRAGVDIHARDDQALLLAAYHGHAETARILIQAGASDHYVLHWLALDGEVGAVRTMLRAGANVGAGVQILRSLSEFGTAEMVEVFLRAGARANSATLSLAAGRGNTEIAKILLQNSVDVHAENDEALRLAARNNRVKTVQALLRAGACSGCLGEQEMKKFLTPDFILSLSSSGVSCLGEIEKCHPELREKYHWSEKKISLKSIREEKIFDVKMVMLDLYYRPGEVAYYQAIAL